MYCCDVHTRTMLFNLHSNLPGMCACTYLIRKFSVLLCDVLLRCIHFVKFCVFTTLCFCARNQSGVIEMNEEAAVFSQSTIISLNAAVEFQEFGL